MRKYIAFTVFKLKYYFVIYSITLYYFISPYIQLFVELLNIIFKCHTVCV